MRIVARQDDDLATADRLHLLVRVIDPDAELTIQNVVVRH